MSKEKKNRHGEQMTPAEAAEEALKEALEAETEQPAEPEEAPEAEAAEENPLAKQLEEANAKTAEYLAMAQRVQADFENYRKRNESVRADAYAEGRKDVAAVMLPVLDNLERAVGAAADSSDEALKNGVELVLKQMADVYQKLDVTPIGEPGTVCQVLQKGYRMGDKVLRHAMVKVVPE